MLLPFGARLLSPMAAAWLRLARAILIVTAVSIAWFWSELVERTWASNATILQIATAVTVFVMIWVIGGALLTTNLQPVHTDTVSSRRSYAALLALLPNIFVLVAVAVVAAPAFPSSSALVGMVFVSSLIIVIVSLKIFEPLGVRVYLDEAVQDAYESYQHGVFDHYLSSAEQAGEGMPPLRFFHWYTSTYLPIARYDELRRKAALANGEPQSKLSEVSDAVVGALNSSELNPRLDTRERSNG